MYNPNSAIERVKNHLAYKLGQTAIEHRHNCGGGYIALFKKLYKIKKQHKKEQKIYQQTIQVFPQLKYPSLEACSDYEQALKYKFHLSYMLGEVLIKAYQTWYKGSGFKLKNDIKKAKKEFQIFREIFKEFDQINSSILKGLIDNKQLFLKEFSRIKNILKIHQDYKAILDNIFHNFNYFIQNFDLIEEWLLSDDFKERYKKENHPYPSLLDPKKLNDKNEKINYKNIPAELAWEMNLLLPRNYRFIFITGGSCGHMAMFLYFKLLKINRNWTSETEKEKYKIAYNVFIASKEYNIFSCQWIQMTRKLFYLADAEVPLIVLLRDPIERLKSSTNHIVKHSTQFDLTLNPNEVLANKYYKMKDY
ncbi:sugar transferase, partial [Campylobacter jejuni]|nr:sugar transferase [Campylobacter jejuni]